mmetsp:Transcript_20996/g.34705  ORF Transcript_20996/g.34705 Transcript_20996/m.34705 type:complete len:394 (-) Transcript_20996:254-1435(-)|eukprot:CAMPEP_0119013590 /NCGR_PEP_ID=MMETSP1176-20130426/8529_1 /TAXON_ID=265551 /ORGANISM="Synedropsis recta cf, Strain CCMP1620" /LENGTH=393 /DNA_ID=CAMNT_0006966693 /DNA_START=73 /DNA_END=1254 /DNA_ORIENTATION=+
MPLKTLSDNIQQPVPPVTPGKQVRRLEAELEKKDSQIDDLTKALTSLNLVKGKIELDDSAVEKTKKTKKDVDAPVLAKTAYKFFADATPKQDGVDMRLAWKECAPEIRKVHVSLAEADKARYTREITSYDQEKLALEMYYEKKKQTVAMEFYEAHIAAQTALENNANETKKSKKKTKDPEAPKRPLSSYMYFSMEKRTSVALASPNAAQTEIVKTLGEMWGKLNKGKGGKNGTKKYDALAATDKSRYDTEKAVYDEMIAKRNIESAQEKADQLKQDKEEAMKLMQSFQTSETTSMVVEEETASVADGKKIKKKKDPNAPKKASSAYIYFSVENRAAVKSSMCETVSNTELLTEVGRQWKELTDKKKEKYNAMAAKDKERYAKEMETYTPAGKN